MFWWSRSPGCKVSSSGRRVLGSKSDSTQDPSCMWVCSTLNPTSRPKHLTEGLVRKRGEGVSGQVSSSSFDHSLNFEVYPNIALELLQNGT
ncbi:hypothetical protein AVEN_97644-1 [Araneus ventricosus]|uniref:Uncharacterized protein n=1 Tax=Araneus ventricosus TaxID=182803 RepID=A0A4Y2GXC1_ARAVE|nr:hypothetical protein AVEN_97644-1 [Araneus ventricosus]